MQQTVFLVTGCSTGIGKSLALMLSDRGHLVYAGVRDVGGLASVASNNLRPVTLDVNNSDHIAAVMQQVASEQGRLDVVINNAGYGAMGPLAEVPIEQLQRQFETNVYAPVALTQQALPLLERSDRPIVVNIGSAAGIFTVPFSGVYNSSKAALHAISDVMRMELASFGIHVMTVYPGGVASNFGDTAAGGLSDNLIPDSRYRSSIGAIEKRARLSSGSATTPDMFSERLIKAIFRRTPPASICIGQGSHLMLVLHVLLPQRLREYLMRRAYGLHQRTHTPLEQLN
jgi:NAD(P)-dependent dehydrogenase (short-subunit alcohol dehydrogenase family)